LNSPSKNWLGIVDSALYLNDPALRTLELQELESITPNGIQNIYDTYFKGAQNYTLAIVGDIALDKVRSEVLRAVATLAKSEHKSTPPSKTRNYPNPTSSVTLAVSGNGTQSASVVLRYSLSKTKAVQFTEVELALMASWVREELTLAIREKAGLTYNISAVLDGQTIFQDSYTLIISASTDPANTKELIEEIDSTLTALLTIQPPELKVQNWLDSMEADHKQALNAAEQQAAVISGAEIYGRKVAKSFEPLTVSNNFTPSFLANALRGFLSKGAVRTQLTWLP
jgi:predicted Zn-dependent peptidase